MEEHIIGKVTHYFSKIGVAVIELSGPLKAGDKIHIKGSTSDFEQPVQSMQIDHKDVGAGEPGQSVGMKVKGTVREGDYVYKVVE